MDYECFLKHYKLIAIDSSKQIELENPDLKQLKQQMFFITGKSEETIFEFKQNSATIVSLLTIYKMETQRSVNLLDDANNESSKFATRKYVINDQSNTEYGEGNENDTTIKFETKVIKPFLCDYSHAYILVTGDITATDGDANIKADLKIVFHLQNA